MKTDPNITSNINIVDFPEANLPEIVRWRNDSAVNKYLRPAYRTLHEVEEWYQGYFGSHGNRLFAIQAADSLIGYCTIEAIEKDNNKCEMGIVIGEPPFWHKGIGSMVVVELLRRAFVDLRMHRVEAVIQSDNVASTKLFEAVGFHLDGRLRDAKRRDNHYVDLLVYSILESEWRDLHPVKDRQE